MTNLINKDPVLGPALHCQPGPCNEKKVFPVPKFSQGKPHLITEILFTLQETCFQNRMFAEHTFFYPVKWIAVYFGWLWRLELCDKTFYKALKFSEPFILRQNYDYEYQDDDFQYSENLDNSDDSDDYDYPDSKAVKDAETIHGNTVSFYARCPLAE